MSVTRFAATFDPLDLSDPSPCSARAPPRAAVFYSPRHRLLGHHPLRRHQDDLSRPRNLHRRQHHHSHRPPFRRREQMLAVGDYTPEPVLSNNVPPSHTRIRALVNRLFTPRRIEELRAGHPRHRRARRRAHHRNAPVDIVANLTYEYPRPRPFSCAWRARRRCAAGEDWAGNRIKLYYGRPSTAEQVE